MEARAFQGRKCVESGVGMSPALLAEHLTVPQASMIIEARAEPREGKQQCCDKQQPRECVLTGDLQSWQREQTVTWLRGLTQTQMKAGA